MERFNADPGVLNKTFVLNGTPRTLIGIMPPRFAWYEADVFFPEAPIRGGATGYGGFPARWFLLGRLKPSVSRTQAAADEQVTGFFQPLLARVKAIPGVADATESTALPPYAGMDSKLEVFGKSHTEEWHTLLQTISEGYFRVLRIPFKMGRAFSEAEIRDARKVAVVNETFVSAFLRGEDPLGRRINLAGLKPLRIR
jgi:hypothetical protein